MCSGYRVGNQGRSQRILRESKHFISLRHTQAREQVQWRPMAFLWRTKIKNSSQ